MNELGEWAMIAFIVIGIVIAVWRSGQANPTGTGTLGRKVSHLDASVGKLGTRIGHVESELEDLQKSAATTKDIETVRAEIGGVKEILQRSERGLHRIEEMLIRKGLDGK